MVSQLALASMSYAAFFEKALHVQKIVYHPLGNHGTLVIQDHHKRCRSNSEPFPKIVLSNGGNLEASLTRISAQLARTNNEYPGEIRAQLGEPSKRPHGVRALSALEARAEESRGETSTSQLAKTLLTFNGDGLKRRQLPT